MDARYYNPQTGRFLSPDPVGLSFCLDLYAYANGDPINYHDPDGYFSSPVYGSIYPSYNLYEWQKALNCWAYSTAQRINQGDLSPRNSQKFSAQSLKS